MQRHHPQRHCLKVRFATWSIAVIVAVLLALASQLHFGRVAEELFNVKFRRHNVLHTDCSLAQIVWTDLAGITSVDFIMETRRKR